MWFDFLHTGRQKTGYHPILQNTIWDPHMNLSGKNNKIPIPVMYKVSMSFELQVGMCAKKTVFVQIKIWVALRCVGAIGWQNMETL